MRLLGFLCIVFLSVGSLVAKEFSDTAGHRYQESIAYIANAGIVQGYPDGTFGPDRTISRAELVKIVIEAGTRAELAASYTINIAAVQDILTEQATSVLDGIEDLGGCFDDVGREWFAPYVCIAKRKSVIQGYPDGTFQPHKTVNMVEGLKIALEQFVADEINRDNSSEHRWMPYVDLVHERNLWSRHSIMPYRGMTRGEMAYLIHQLLLHVSDQQPLAMSRDSRSTGCFGPRPNNAPTSLMVDGISRSMITHVGHAYNHSEPTDLILAFHGRTSPNSEVRGYYKLEQATAGDAIIVYPSGLPEAGPQRNWSDPGDGDELRDLALFDAIVADITSNYCVDMDRVFAVGHSLGAWFSHSLSCLRGDVLRAVGTVGGGTTLTSCNGPSAAIVMHNPEDRLSPFRSGETARNQLVKQNSCSQATVSVGPAGYNCIEYQGCLYDEPVVWCPHSDSIDYRGQYYPHTWPDEAGRVIWEFFEHLK